MNIQRSLYKLALILCCGVGLTLLALWLLATPRALTAKVEPFYSPIEPIGDPQIQISKTSSNAQPQVGDEIVYTLTYANLNPGTQAFNVRLFDFLPDGLLLLSTDPPFTASQNGMLLFTAPTVGPTTEPVQITVRARVLEGYKTLRNHSLVTADGVVPVHASLSTPVTQPPAWMRLVKTGYSTVLTNGEIVYTLMCENTAQVTLNHVTLIDVLPTGLSLVDASLPPDEVTPPLVKWTLGDMLPGERRTVVITSTAPDAVGMITNTAMLDARQRVITPTLFATEVVSQGAILRVSKTGSAPAVNVGDQLIYTLRYENAGNQVATDVRLTDTFPSDIDIIDVSTVALSPTLQQRVWMLGQLNPGETGQIVITTVVRGKGDRILRNVADITAQAGSFPEHAELETIVRPSVLYLPMVMRRYIHP